MAEITIKTQPKSVITNLNDTFSMNVEASSDSTITYQWEFKRDGQTTWSNTSINGNKTSTISDKATTDRSNVSYRCKLTSGSNSIYSDSAILKIANTDDVIKENLRFVKTTNENLDNLQIKNGQLIFVEDIGKIYLDYNNERNLYNSIIEINNDKERINLISPMEKIYYVRDTKLFWSYYNKEWIQISDNWYNEKLFSSGNYTIKEVLTDSTTNKFFNINDSSSPFITNLATTLQTLIYNKPYYFSSAIIKSLTYGTSTYNGGQGFKIADAHFMDSGIESSSLLGSLSSSKSLIKTFKNSFIDSVSGATSLLRASSSQYGTDAKGFYSEIGTWISSGFLNSSGINNFNVALTSNVRNTSSGNYNILDFLFRAIKVPNMKLYNVISSMFTTSGIIVFDSNQQSSNNLSSNFGTRISNGYAFGLSNTVSGRYNAFVFGNYNYVPHPSSNSASSHSLVVMGEYLQTSSYLSSYSLAIFGQYNKDSSGSDLLIVGNGTSNSNRSNAMRLTGAGYLYYKTGMGSGADYAELYEWSDGNPNNEDRCGYFVTFDFKDYDYETAQDLPKIKIATEGDYILGVISGNPSFVGNSDMEWKKRWLYDDFDRPLVKAVEMDVTELREVDTGETRIEIQYDENDNEIEVEVPVTELQEVKTGEKKIDYQHIENPDYNDDLNYVSRTDRTEWSATGMLGVLSVRDDGTCKVGEYCKCNKDGIATAAESRSLDTFLVVKRIKDNIIKIVLR